jgi:hypothetical protein
MGKDSRFRDKRSSLEPRDLHSFSTSYDFQNSRSFINELRTRLFGDTSFGTKAVGKSVGRRLGFVDNCRLLLTAGVDTICGW